MSGKRKSKKFEEPAKMPKLDAEISIKFWDTKSIPDVIWQKIFGFFSLEEIKLKVARVCRHFYEISNDCVQEVMIDEHLTSKYKSEIFYALPTFKYLKTVKMANNHFYLSSSQSVGFDFFVIHALKNCPRLKHLYIMQHELTIGLFNKIVR